MKKKRQPSQLPNLRVYNYGKQPSNLSKQQVPPRKKDLSENITQWEVRNADAFNRNNFPQQLLQNVYNSPVGSAALDIWQEFVEGDGFVNPECGDIIVNKKGETLDELHQKISADIAYLWGFAVHVSYNAEGLKNEFKHLPFESTRLGIIDKKGEVTDIRFNPYFGVPQDKYYIPTAVFYTYNPNPDDVIQEMKEHAVKFEDGKVDFKYPGQVFWFSIERPLARVYPQPFYYSSINWFKIDAEIQKFHERNIDNNFLLSVIINMHGNPDEPAGSETETETKDRDQFETVGEVFDRQMKEHFSGAENGGSALVNWFMRETEKADIQQFPTNSHHELFTVLQKLTTEQISIGTKTPPVLLSIREAGKLGDVQEIVNAVMVMQSRTKRMRNALKREYKRLFKDFKGSGTCIDYTIKNLNPFNILPQWAINAMTITEKREYINENFPIELTAIVTDSEIDSSPTNDAMKNLTGRQFQGIQRIVRKYNKEEITYDQASQMLKSGFALTDEEIDVWLVSAEEEEIIEETIEP